MFLFLLPTKYEKHFLTEQRENELLTPQKPAPHVVQEKLAVVSSLIESPTTRQSLQQCGYVNSPENEELQKALSTLQEDATASVQATKRKRSTDARTAAQVSLWWSILFECVYQNRCLSQLRSVPRAILQRVLRIDFAGSKTDLDGYITPFLRKNPGVNQAIYSV